MKIGVLTFHDGINHGAYLQCYALYRTLQKMGHEVEVINYKNFTHWWKEYGCFLFTGNPLKLFENIYKIIKFRKSQRIFNLGSLAFSAKKVREKHFYAIVIGSDIVWNFRNSLFGFDPIYFGYSLNADRLISYAASFGASNIRDNPPPQVIKGLPRFHAISVRDENSKVTVDKICKKEAKVVLDPIFLYNFSGDEFLPSYKKFVLVYAFFIPKNEIIKIKEFARKRGLKLIAVGYRQSWCDINKVAIDPFRWLGYFKKADFIVTGSYHGIIFSIKYNKSFCVSMNDAIYSKSESFLVRFSLKDRVISSTRSVEDVLCEEIKYASINPEIDRALYYSKNFLEGALNG